MPRKPKIRWGTLGAIAGAIGGVVVTIVSEPVVLEAAAPRIGLSVAVLSAIIAGAKKAVTRRPEER